MTRRSWVTRSLWAVRMLPLMMSLAMEYMERGKVQGMKDSRCNCQTGTVLRWALCVCVFIHIHTHAQNYLYGEWPRRNVSYVCGPQPLWHQGAVPWKTVFSTDRQRGDGFGTIQPYHIQAGLLLCDPVCDKPRPALLCSPEGGDPSSTSSLAAGKPG